MPMHAYMAPPEPANMNTEGSSAKLTLVLYWKSLVPKREDILQALLTSRLLNSIRDHQVITRSRMC